jgi:Tfp pilus assembly protein PilE
MISPHDIDADFERLTSVITGLGTLAGVAYTAYQNFRARKQLDRVHTETLKAINPEEPKT